LLREACELARAGGESVVLAKALRRLSVLLHLRGEPGARDMCRDSFDVAMALGDRLLAAEAENTGASFAFEAGETEAARDAYHRALGLADGDAELEGRIEQNLGIVANVHGDLPAALEHYHRSLDRFKTVRNLAGCAIAYHSLGLISTDQGLWQAAPQ
jgi:tetratricopeptide (TPR) repeat protein